MNRTPWIALMLAGALVALPLDDASSKPVRCLPSKKCQSAAACCKFDHDQLFAAEVAHAQIAHDFYADAAKQAAAHDQAVRELGRRGGDAQHVDEYAGRILKSMFNDYLGEIPKKIFDDLGGINDKLDLPTHCWETGDDCSIYPLAGCEDGAKPVPQSEVQKENTCKEFIKAIKDHEQQHADKCNAAKKGGKSTKGLDSSAQDEADGYAAQAHSLRQQYMQAHERCSAKRKAADQKKQQEARSRARALKATR